MAALKKLQFVEHRAWLHPDEAATYLGELLQQPVSTEHLFRLALDGELTISVSLPVRVRATFTEGDEVKSRLVDGLWELVMEGPGKLEIEREYRTLKGLSYVGPDGGHGASVRRGDTTCVLPPSSRHGMWAQAASSLPEGALLVIQLHHLTSFTEAAKVDRTHGVSIPSRPLDATPPRAITKPSTSSAPRQNDVDAFLIRVRRVKGCGVIPESYIWRSVGHAGDTQYRHWKNAAHAKLDPRAKACRDFEAFLVKADKDLPDKHLKRQSTRRK